jgi:Thioredoxin-like
MQKRRNHQIAASLPMTSLESKGMKRVMTYDGNNFGGIKLLSVLMLIFMALLVVACLRQFSIVASGNKTLVATSLETSPLKSLPFSQFPTLRKALKESDLIGLYFAASWCPMSARPTKLLGEIFEKMLASDPSKLAIVYVSSDEDESSLQSYAKPHWRIVPFDSSERIALKKYFSVCARRELEELEMERKYEIPSLFLFDGPSHTLFSKHGVSDLQDHPSMEVYELWRATQRVVRGLLDKYVED